MGATGAEPRQSATVALIAGSLRSFVSALCSMERTRVTVVPSVKATWSSDIGSAPPKPCRKRITCPASGPLEPRKRERLLATSDSNSERAVNSSALDAWLPPSPASSSPGSSPPACSSITRLSSPSSAEASRETVRPGSVAAATVFSSRLASQPSSSASSLSLGSRPRRSTSTDHTYCFFFTSSSVL